MSSEILETSSSGTLETLWPRSPTPEEAEVIEAAAQPEVEAPGVDHGVAVAGEDHTAGIEEELGPCVRQEVAVEEVVIPVVVP